MGFLLLGVDSLIACIAVAPLISLRAALPFAALFGIGDAGGFLLGAAFHWSIPGNVSNIVQTGVLAGLGCYWIAIAVFFAGKGQAFAGRRLAWILPAVLSIDNVAYGVLGGHAGSLFSQAGAQALSSTLLAVAGLAVGMTLARTVPAMRRHAEVANGVAGAALIIASGVLLVAG